MKTFVPTPGSEEKTWWLIDAEGARLGRLATRVADLLRGKHRPTFTPHLDMGDFVVIVNADKIDITGDKINQKSYFRHSTYPGGSHVLTMREAMGKHPELVLFRAIRGMIPHTKLGRKVIKKLKIYSGPSHPHAAQQLKPWTDWRDD